MKLEYNDENDNNENSDNEGMKLLSDFNISQMLKESLRLNYRDE